MSESIIKTIQLPERIWFELNEENDACDAIVQMDDGTVYTALFVTFSYLKRQMQLGYEVSKQIPDTPAVQYVAIDTPHILVEELTKAIIEDTIDNLIALDVFEGLFTRVTEKEGETEEPRTTSDGKRATQEVAAVVISDVLVVQD